MRYYKVFFLHFSPNTSSAQIIGRFSVDYYGGVGPTGATGSVGATGPEGPKGSTGESAQTPSVDEIMVFDYGDLNGAIEPRVVDLTSHRVFTITCLIDQGDGGVKTWRSDDQLNWELEYRAGCGGSGSVYNQNTSKVKSRFYKVVLEGAFKGYVSMLAY